ncbi:YunG family protein [Austwickia chelonae]|uniref:YunG family protein n=1 Tax=Austwickia chelonae TaxID=100225 RepID=UPI000E2457DD|nr:hypothetical protein [Austwickia chelonae]
MALDIERLAPVIRDAWGPDTCYPYAREQWSVANPSREQCGMTALVIHDLLGGDLLLGEVFVDGRKTGYHYWNRLPDGTVVDLTAEQFTAEESVVGYQVVERPSGRPRHFAEPYFVLRARVLEALDRTHPS